MSAVWGRLPRRAGVTLGAALLAAAVSSAPAPAQDREWTGTIVEDDDFWAPQNHDAYYTHGIRLSATTGDVQASFWQAPFDGLGGVTSAFPSAPGASRRYNLVLLGQNMYTPRNPTLFNPDPRDRPYAGWLYGGVGLMQDTPVEAGQNTDRFDELALKLGIVGPGSLANATQTRYHLLIHVTTFKGWHAQLRNEPAVDLFYQRKWRYLAESAGGWGFDAIPQWDIRAGNVYDYLGAGGMLRMGHNLRIDYGPPHIDLNTGSDYINPERATSGAWALYLFIAAEARAVAHNIFLDGNDFKPSAHVEKFPAVGDFEAGVAFAYEHFRFAYTWVLRSPEFVHQVGTDHYGSLTLSIRFAL